MKKILVLIVVVPLLISCSNRKYSINNNHKVVAVKDTNSFDILMDQFAHNIENIWGIDEVIIAGPKDYVKYTDQHNTRSHINFDAGSIVVETIATNTPRVYLRQAIISTLSMNNAPGTINFYLDSNNIPINKELFLYYDPALDNNGAPMRWKWHVDRFVDYLLQVRLQTRTTAFRKIWFVTIQIKQNHVDERAHQYLEIVRKASQKYGVDQSLILAIVQTESSFNPYAVSHSDALGLMQIVQHSAGRDVFKKKGKWGQPSRTYLFDPQNNIDVGTAYLALLQDSYLSGIVNPTSKRYAVITAYNSGAGNVLRVFSCNQNQAFKIINGMQPEEVYEALFTRHPSVESRRYLYKVDNLQKDYFYWQRNA